MNAANASTPIVELPPPSPTVRAAVEKFVLELIAKGVLVELGLLPGDDEECDMSSIR